MVDDQIAARDLKDRKVLGAMRKVPRHRFIPEDARGMAYQDGPVPIGHGQTISQPYIVALMTELLQVQEGDRGLEVGSGSGYQAAVLSELGAKVYSIETIPELAQFARRNLLENGYSSVEVKTGDGTLGWKEHAPYDAVIVACAPEKVPEALKNQLKEGGRIVIPLGPENQIQELYLMKKWNGELIQKAMSPVRFVPMVGQEEGKR